MEYHVKYNMHIYIYEPMYIYIYIYMIFYICVYIYIHLHDILHVYIYIYIDVARWKCITMWGTPFVTLGRGVGRGRRVDRNILCETSPGPQMSPIFVGLLEKHGTK